MIDLQNIWLKNECATSFTYDLTPPSRVPLVKYF